VVAVRSKTLLPTYDVFDEDRYFEPASDNTVIPWQGRRLGLTICEDLWNEAEHGVPGRYRPDPAAALVAGGADLLVNLSASPWHLGKEQRRRGLLTNVARRHRVPVVYCNLVGGNDELVFDGGSLAIDASGGCLAEATRFAPDLLVVDVGASAARPPAGMADEALLHDALVLGTRDYVRKCGFSSVVLWPCRPSFPAGAASTTPARWRPTSGSASTWCPSRGPSRRSSARWGRSSRGGPRTPPRRTSRRDSGA
jgi:hypothetical protein